MANGHDHGNTPAAWTGVTIALIGFTIGGAFMTMAQPLGVLAGLVVVALGGVVGAAMRSMGMGKQESADPVSVPHQATSDEKAAEKAEKKNEKKADEPEQVPAG
ncbi:MULTISPECIES: HGxxPAAW family protein [Streptomyces]|uniref:HGxxPAAW family protein n=1 Tax=Streptomyces TaxID=1883 RepID=UPI000CD5BD3B|nr:MULTISPECIES: HGxxPAAW family protein [Streptomyces]